MTKTEVAAKVQYVITMRTMEHRANDTGTGVIRCECGKTADTPQELARRHSRSPRVTPGIRRVEPGQ